MAELNLRLRQAIAAARAGKAPQAKLLAESALEEEPEDINALLLLSALAETKEKQIAYLDRILAKDPDHAVAKKRLAQLTDVPASAIDTPVDTLEADDVETGIAAPALSVPAMAPAAPQDEREATTFEAQEPEAQPLPGEALSDSAVGEDETLPTQEATEPSIEQVGDLSATDELEEPFFQSEAAMPAAESETFELDQVPDPLLEEDEAEAEPLYERVEAPLSDEIAESPSEEFPTFEAESIGEPSFEELETPLPDEFVEPSTTESQAFEPEVLPEVFARKVNALLPDEMAEQFAHVFETPPAEETQEPLLEEIEAFPFEEGTQTVFETVEAFSEIEDSPEDDLEDTLFEESSAPVDRESFESFPENEVAAFSEEASAEEISEPFLDDDDFPVTEETDFPSDDPVPTLISQAPELPDEAAPEQSLDELHDFPVEDLWKPAAVAEDASPADLHIETPDAADAQLFESSPLEMDDLAAEEAAPTEEQSPERPFLAVTAPLSHDVVESPPEAREGLAAQLDEEQFEEEAGPGLENLVDQNSLEAGQALAASVAGLESQQDDGLGNEDVFASLVEEVAEPATGDADLITGFEPAAESDIPEWLREAEDSSLATSAVEDESGIALQEPAELNDIPAWLLDDGDEEWLEAVPETKVVPTTFAEEPINADTAPGVSPEALVAAPAAVADYSDDDIDAAMATIIDDEVHFDSFESHSDAEELAEMHTEEVVDASENEKPTGKVSTRALEIFLIVLVAVAVVVLAALALVVFNPFS